MNSIAPPAGLVRIRARVARQRVMENSITREMHFDPLTGLRVNRITDPLYPRNALLPDFSYIGGTPDL